MRLLIVSQYFWPEEFRVNDLVLGLVQRGHEVTVLTGQPNYPEGRIYDGYRSDPASYQEYAGADVVRTSVIPRGNSSGIRLILNYLSFAFSSSTVGVWHLRNRKFDAALVFQTSPITAALPALVLRRTKGVPILLWVQDLWPDTLSAIGLRSPLLLGFVEYLVKIIYANCDRILVQSRVFEERVRRFAGDTIPVHYLPNWFDPVFSAGLPDIPAPEVEPFSATFNVMFAGNFGEAQDLLSVLQAALLCKDIPELRWLLVGDGRVRQALEAAVVEMGLSERVHFLGRHPAARMPAFFTAADALLVSLKAEPIWSMTIPSKVQSYMAAGRPVLAMIDGEGARVISESGGGLTSAAGDAAALAANVRRLMTHSVEQRKAMARAGRDYATANFDRDTLLREVETRMEEASGDPG